MTTAVVWRILLFYDPPGAVDTAYRLYQQEIYHLDMSHTQLAILSACETGTGQLVDGEGIISLSRAFAYAGCKVPSPLCGPLMTSHLPSSLKNYTLTSKKGFPLDKSLQQAKLNYLNQDTIALRLKRPLYWANFILMGDARHCRGKDKYG